jgi:hypothetical protein
MTASVPAHRPPRNRARVGRTLAAAALAVAAGSGVAAAETPGSDPVYSGSVQVASGHYIFTDRTTSVYIVNGVNLTPGRFVLSASLPVIVQSTPWVTFAPVPIPSGGGGSGQVGSQIRDHMGRGSRSGSGTLVVTLPVESVSRQAGVGDPLLRGGISLLSTVVKAPIAAYDDGLGTGEWDGGAGMSLDRALGADRVFGTVEYWRLGDLPELVLNDAAMYQAGYEHVLGSGRWSVLALAQGWTTILDGTDPPIDAGFGIERRLSGSRGVSMTVSFGLTETAPDFTLSFGWRLPF